MKSGIRRRVRRGMTLVEMTIAIGLGIIISSILMAVFNQQLAFLKIFRAQNFLTDEAPMISTYVSKLVGQADRFSLHPTLSHAFNEANQRLTDSPVARLYYRQPDGSYRSAILSFEDRGSGDALYYFVVPQNGGPLPDPEWTVTRVPKDVSFAVTDGVLRMTLIGPYDEKVTYSGTMHQ